MSPDGRESRIQRELHNISLVYGALRTEDATSACMQAARALLLAFDGERVSFRWKVYAHGNKQKKMTLEAGVSAPLYLSRTFCRGASSVSANSDSTTVSSRDEAQLLRMALATIHCRIGVN